MRGQLIQFTSLVSFPRRQQLSRAPSRMPLSQRDIRTPVFGDAAVVEAVDAEDARFEMAPVARSPAEGARHHALEAQAHAAPSPKRHLHVAPDLICRSSPRNGHPRMPTNPSRRGALLATILKE